MALKVWDRRSARRVAAVDEFRFPSAVRQRFGFTFPAVSAAGLTTAEEALRQWFRLHARHPKARLSMPSVAVDAMWRELTLHTAVYADLCGALGQAPQSASTEAGLRDAYVLACEDEPVERPRLPLLFRVDRELAVPGGNHYLGDCGGRAQCHQVSGVRCLQHVAGLEKKRGPWKDPNHVIPYPQGENDIGGCGST